MASGTINNKAYRLADSKTGTTAYSFTSTNDTELCVFVISSTIQSSINIPISKLSSTSQNFYVGWGDTTGGFVSIFSLAKNGNTISGALNTVKVNGASTITTAKIDIYAK